MHYQITRLLVFFLMLGLFSTCKSQEEQPTIIVPDFSPPALENDVRSPLYISSDYGYTWQKTTTNLPSELQISFIDQFGDVLLLATDNMGLYLSSDDKTQWKNISKKLPNPKINALFTVDTPAR